MPRAAPAAVNGSLDTHVDVIWQFSGNTTAQRRVKVNVPGNFFPAAGLSTAERPRLRRRRWARLRRWLCRQPRDLASTPTWWARLWGLLLCR